MRLKMKARQEVTAVAAGQYRGASKKEKRVLRDQFVSTTGYSRWYARFVLRHQGRRVQADKHRTLLAVSRRPPAGKGRRGFCRERGGAPPQAGRGNGDNFGQTLQPRPY